MQQLQAHACPTEPFCQADLAGHLVSRAMAPKDVQVLILGLCGCVTSCDKKDFEDMILKWEMILDYGPVSSQGSL